MRDSAAGGREVNTMTVMAAITVVMGVKFVSSLTKQEAFLEGGEAEKWRAERRRRRRKQL